MTTDFGHLSISSSDDPESVDFGLVKRIVKAVNAQLEEYAAANGSMTQDAMKQMAKNLIMRQLEEHTFTAADEGRGVMSAADEIAVRDAVLDRMFGMPFGALLADEEVEDIYISGAEPVVVKYFGGRKETRPPVADSDADLLNQVTSIATHQGMNERDVTAARPFLNMDLPGYDARLGLIFDVTPHPMVTIRRHRFVNVHLEHLVKWGDYFSFDDGVPACRGGGEAVAAGRRAPVGRENDDVARVGAVHFQRRAFRDTGNRIRVVAAHHPGPFQAFDAGGGTGRWR